ncbi:hypothetical protein C8R47DRAFT_1227888 [Mycena vitilis]|nr:hypothetical protein C8R47DRAFT_1227888 [Mycena vitilis]
MLLFGRADAKAAALIQVSAANSLLLSYSHHHLFSSLAQRPHYQLRPASARSVTITPPQKSNKKGKAVVAKPTIHPSYTPAQVKALWAPLVCAPVQALLPLLTTGAVARRSSAQLQSLFAGAEKVLRRFREDTGTGPIEIEAFLLSIWVAVREAKRAYPEFPWKTQFPTLYNLVPNDLPRRAEIETFVPSLPDSSFTLPEIPAHLQFASSDDDELEAPPPTKKARYQSPSVVPDTPPPQPSSSRRQRSPPAVERPKPKPTGKAATLASRRHHVSSRNLSPEVEEAPRPKKNVHHFDQAADLEAYARHTHETGYVSDGFDAAVEVYPRLIDHPQGGVLAPHVAVEKVPTAVVHDATIVPEGHMTFYICTNCATRGQRCISRGLGKRCFSCHKGKMSCSLHPGVIQLLTAQERLRPLNNIGSSSIVNVLQRLVVARRHADLSHYLLRNAMLDYDDVLTEACLLLEQQRQDLQILFTLFARLGIEYGTAMSDLRQDNPPPTVFGLSKDGEIVDEADAEPNTQFYVRGVTEQAAFAEFDRLPPVSDRVEERIHKIPADFHPSAVGPPPAAVLEQRRQLKPKPVPRLPVTPAHSQASPQRAVSSAVPRGRPTSPDLRKVSSYHEPSASTSRKRQYEETLSSPVQVQRRPIDFSVDETESVFRRPPVGGSLNLFAKPSAANPPMYTTSTDSGCRIPLTEQVAYAEYETARRQGEARVQAQAQPVARSPSPFPVDAPSVPIDESSFLTKPGSPEGQEASFQDLDNSVVDTVAGVGDMPVG